MTNFLSIAEAARLTGRHEKTIRRWVKKQLDSDAQAKEKIVQETTASGFSYRIDKDYLLAHPATSLDNSPPQGTEHPPEQGSEQATGQPIGRYTPLDPVIAAKDETIALLKEQIQQQQEELHRKNEQLKTVLERLGEQNVLLQGYHNRYLLPAPQGRGGFNITLDSPSGQGAEQGTVHTPGQGRQANPLDMDTRQGQKEQPDTHKEGKPLRRPPHRSSKVSKKSEQEQPKKKGFFSFLRGK